MLNNKGFAVTSVLYTLLIAFLLFLGAALTQFSSSTKIFDKSNRDLTNNYSTFDFNSSGNLILNYDGTEQIVSNFPRINVYYKIDKEYVFDNYKYFNYDKNYEGYDTYKNGVSEIYNSDGTRRDSGTKQYKLIKGDDDNSRIVSLYRTKNAEENEYRTLMQSFLRTNAWYYDIVKFPFNAKEYYDNKLKINICQKDSNSTADCENVKHIKDKYTIPDWKASIMYCNRNNVSSEDNVVSCDDENETILPSSNVKFGDIKSFLYNNILNSNTGNEYSFIELVFSTMPRIRVYYNVGENVKTNDNYKINNDTMLVFRVNNDSSNTFATNYLDKAYYNNRFGIIDGYPIKAKTQEELGIEKDGYEFVGWKAKINYIKGSSTIDPYKNECGESYEIGKKLNCEDKTQNDVGKILTEVTINDIENYVKKYPSEEGYDWIQIVFKAQWKKN